MGTLSSSADLNDNAYLKQGIYNLRGVSVNAPISGIWGLYVVIAPTNVVNYFITFASYNNENRLYGRIIYSPATQGNEIFGEWKQIF